MGAASADLAMCGRNALRISEGDRSRAGGHSYTCLRAALRTAACPLIFDGGRPAYRADSEASYFRRKNGVCSTVVNCPRQATPARRSWLASGAAAECLLKVVGRD
jgi:hypothetical protein